MCVVSPASAAAAPRRRARLPPAARACACAGALFATFPLAPPASALQVFGRTYFSAAPGHGTFVDRSSLSPYSAESAAASTVAELVRGRRAEGAAYAAASLALDADEELRALQRRAALQQKQLEETLLGETLNRPRPEPALAAAWEEEAAAAPLPADYAGPHLPLPLTAASVRALVESFRRGDGGAATPLAYKYVVALVCAYRRYAAELPTLVEVEVAPGTRVTVCGDTHGQLQDLYSIYTLNGVPSPANRYLMNGDFVDRGERSVELTLTLMAWALLYPGEPRTSRGSACERRRARRGAVLPGSRAAEPTPAPPRPRPPPPPPQACSTGATTRATTRTARRASWPRS